MAGVYLLTYHKKSIFRNYIFIRLSLYLLPVIFILSSHAFAYSPHSAQFLNINVGARQAGMGEAYVALAEGPSALTSNPAGIAQSEISELVLTHIQHFQQINYEYIGYIVPIKRIMPFFADPDSMESESAKLSDRYGVLGIGLYYVGFGSIDKYDIKGDIQGEIRPYNFALAFSYANNITEKFRWLSSLLSQGEGKELYFGWSAKFVQEKLGETSAKAFAIDLGTLYTMYSGRLGFGLSVQNIGTQMEYLQESYSLPLKYKAGLRYLFTKDVMGIVECTFKSGDELEFNLGGEYHIGEWLIMRLGFRNQDLGSGIRFGIGIGKGNFQLNHSYGSYGELGGTHQISIDYKFGVSMYEQELIEHFNLGKDLYLIGRFDKARDEFNKVLALSPDFVEAKEYIIKIDDLLEKRESDYTPGTARSEAERHFIRGRNLYQREDFLQAEREFRRVLEFNPEHKEAKEYIEKIQSKFRQAAGGLYIQALVLYENGDYKKSIQLLEMVQEEDPQHPGVAKYIELAKTKMKEKEVEDRRIREEDARRRAEEDRRRREEEKEKAKRDMYNRALSHYNRGELKNALVLFQRVRREDSKYRKVQVYIDKVKDELARQHYDRGLELILQGELEEAIRELNKALIYNPDDENIRKSLEDAEEKIRASRMDEAEGLYNQGLIDYLNGNLKEAIKSWEEVLRIDPGHKKAKTNLERARKELDKRTD